MSIKDMPCVTVEQVLALRKAAIELEAREFGYIQSLRELEAELTEQRDAAREIGLHWQAEAERLMIEGAS